MVNTNKKIITHDDNIKKAAYTKPKRKRISEKNKKLLQKEVNSKCPKCDYTGVTELDIHHIDGNIENNNFNNLLMLCPNCHKKVTNGNIKMKEIIALKKDLRYKINENINFNDIMSLKRILSHLNKDDIEYILHKYSSSLGFNISISCSIESFFDSCDHIDNVIYNKKLKSLLNQFVISLQKYYILFSDNSELSNGIVRISYNMKMFDHKKYHKLIKELDKLGNISYKKFQNLINFVKLKGYTIFS